MLTTTLKSEAKNKSGLILPGESELSDVQMVVASGPYNRSRDENGEKISFEPGDYVKLNLQRFWKPKKGSNNSLQDGPAFSDSAVEFFIPVVTIGGADYLEVDTGDCEYWWSKEVLDLK